MILFKKAAELRNYLDIQQKQSRKIGFIPTMGALHEGHISLITSSAIKSDCTVCSIFVNPAQFNDSSDFKKYPVTIEKDIYLLDASGCDVLFLPSVDEIYPDGFRSPKHYTIGYLETILEGKYRPGHFQGVCLVMNRLLDIVKPNQLYLGQKDYQQCMIITRLIDLMELSDSIEIIISPTMREKNGLAMSSRNLRLNEVERNKASAIYQSLSFIHQHWQDGHLPRLKKKTQEILENNDLKVDYIEIADAKNLELVNEWNGKQKLVALVAAYINEVRLIDNMLLN
jgi:pantoate--beta-alanine ligase